jgi:hypothetical protein
VPFASGVSGVCWNEAVVGVATVRGGICEPSLKEPESLEPLLEEPRWVEPPLEEPGPLEPLSEEPECLGGPIENPGPL